MKKYLQKKFVRFLVEHLFNTVDENDILQVLGKSVIIYRGKQLPAEEVEKIKLDAQTFANSTLWHALSSEAKYQANLKMFNKSMNFDDMMAGKMLLYSINVIEKKLKELQ